MTPQSNLLPRDENRLMILYVSFELLRDWLQGKFPKSNKVKTNLPEDAVITRVYDRVEESPAYANDALGVVVASKEFSKVDFRAEIPRFDLFIS